MSDSYWLEFGKSEIMAVMSTQQPTEKPLPGDYYGTVYKGGFIVPLLVIALVAVAIWWFYRRRVSNPIAQYRVG